MRIRDGFVVREIMGSIMAVPTGVMVEKYSIINLNETGRFIWELLEKEMTEDELIKKIMEHYDVEEQLAKDNIKDFMIFLREKEILIEN